MSQFHSFNRCVGSLNRPIDVRELLSNPKWLQKRPQVKHTIVRPSTTWYLHADMGDLLRHCPPPGVTRTSPTLH